MPRVEVGDHSFQYMEEGGSSPPILLLCSTGLDSKQWKGLLPHLGGRRVICPHYLCYPGTDDWKGEGEIDSWMDYRVSEALLLAEDVPVDIIGHSYGGFICSEAGQGASGQDQEDGIPRADSLGVPAAHRA